MNKDAFDFIRSSLNRIADGIASSDGRYPVWDYKSLLELINTLEEEYKKNDGASARSSLQQSNNLAADCVYRQAAIDALGEKPLAWTEGEYELGLQRQWESDIEAIKGLPSAQPEIVRCKDCKHWREDHTCREHSLVSPMMANEFCSRAERREE